MKKIDIACIIDDDPIFVFATKRMMELTHFCNGFLIYNNGEDAFNQLKPILENGEQVPDIILLDLNMPKMDGWEFLDSFLTIESSKRITIFIVSSSIDPADLMRAKQYESVGNYIVKPISQKDLHGIMETFQSSHK